MVQAVLAEAETLEVVVEVQEVSIPEAVVAVVDITLLQAAVVALVLLSFAISAHSVAQAERSHHQAVIQFTHLQLQGRTQHEPFCTSYCTGHC
jgi:hypothetical protein